MDIRGKRFEVDRANGKVAGVCAGIANMTGVDATIIRIALVVVTVLGAFPWTLLAYAVAAVIGQPKARGGHALQRSSATREESRERMRNLDLRMQAIETYVTSANSPLAREIEDLRRD
jgi:phage shock protein C